MQGALFANGTSTSTHPGGPASTFSAPSSVTYLNDYSILPNANELQSQFYLEGFGAGSYARVESSFYQGLVGSVTDSQLPLVLPYAIYSYTGQPDSLGGTLSVNANAFNISGRPARIPSARRSAAPIRCPSKTISANSGAPSFTSMPRPIREQHQRVPELRHPRSTPPNCAPCPSSPQLPLADHERFRARWARSSSSPSSSSSPHRSSATMSTRPISRTRTATTSSSPTRTSSASTNIRGSTGSRTACAPMSASRASGSSITGGTIDRLIGQSYRAHPDDTFPPDSGLTDNVSDIVARLSYTPPAGSPSPIAPGSNHTTLQDKYTDTFVSAGAPKLRVTAGYLYSAVDPYYYYDGSPPPARYYVPRNEVTFGLTTSLQSLELQRRLPANIQTGQLDSSSLEWRLAERLSRHQPELHPQQHHDRRRNRLDHHSC